MQTDRSVATTSDRVGYRASGLVQ